MENSDIIISIPRFGTKGCSADGGNGGIWRRRAPPAAVVRARGVRTGAVLGRGAAALVKRAAGAGCGTEGVERRPLLDCASVPLSFFWPSSALCLLLVSARRLSLRHLPCAVIPRRFHSLPCRRPQDLQPCGSSSCPGSRSCRSSHQLRIADQTQPDNTSAAQTRRRRLMGTGLT